MRKFSLFVIVMCSMVAGANAANGKFGWFLVDAILASLNSIVLLLNTKEKYE